MPGLGVEGFRDRVTEFYRPAMADSNAAPASLDPVVTNPNHYKVVFENDRVRVLEYRDKPGERTTPHEHPDSVMHALSSFRRRLYADDSRRDVDIPAGTTGWLPAQKHAGENIADTDTDVIFVELKAQSTSIPDPTAPGPS